MNVKPGSTLNSSPCGEIEIYCGTCLTVFGVCWASLIHLIGRNDVARSCIVCEFASALAGFAIDAVIKSTFFCLSFDLNHLQVTAHHLHYKEDSHSVIGEFI